MLNLNPEKWLNIATNLFIVFLIILTLFFIYIIIEESFRKYKVLKKRRIEYNKSKEYPTKNFKVNNVNIGRILNEIDSKNKRGEG